LWFVINSPATASFLRNAGKKKSLASPLMRVSEFGVAQYLNSRNVSARALCLFAHAITAFVVRPVEHQVHILCNRPGSRAGAHRAGKARFKELNGDPQPIPSCQQEAINHPTI
jgi:hypothetical protein